MNNHILSNYDKELHKLSMRLIKMGNFVQEQLELAIESLLKGDLEIAKSVLEIEERINRMDVKIDKQCARIIALHQPVASDLQLVLAGFQINTYFEVIGDMIKEIVDDIMVIVNDASVINDTKIMDLGRSIRIIINRLIQSFIDRDIELSYEAIELGRQINDLYKENFDILTKLMLDDPTKVQSCVYLLDVNRIMKIIASQTRTIAHELVYMFDAKIVKHQHLDDIKGLNSNSDIEIENSINDEEVNTIIE